MANPIPKARRELIRLTVERALETGVNVADRGALYTLLKQVATERGGRPLAYWQLAERNLLPSQFPGLQAAVLRAYGEAREQREADRASTDNSDPAPMPAPPKLAPPTRVKPRYPKRKE